MHGLSSTEDKLVKFLRLVKTTYWREPPSIWSEQVRAAVNGNLITMGFGGVMVLTERGRQMLRDQSQLRKG